MIPDSPHRGLALAGSLSLCTAVALGITRFSYALLLPGMKMDLAWSYALAGGMNTANASGYLIGALATPALLRAFGARKLVVAGALLATVFMAASGFFLDTGALILQRLLAGISSALLFVAGGVLVARLGAAHPSRAGLLLGVYYGGVGLGIIVSALLVPVTSALGAGRPHSWQLAWWVLAIACVAAIPALAWSANALSAMSASDRPLTAALSPALSVWRLFRWTLAGYAMFGMGYIGYMTFIIALLKEQGSSSHQITLFYSLLGLSVIASSKIWATLLDRFKEGQAMAVLNGVTGLAAVLPALTDSWPVTLVSGLVFGAAFMSVPAATTAIVRHNLPATRYGSAISAFTVVFALGQIVGPLCIGWVADGAGGLARGLILSALALWAGALFALRQ